MNQLIKQEKDDHFQEDPLLTENKGDINIAFVFVFVFISIVWVCSCHAVGHLER